MENRLNTTNEIIRIFFGFSVSIVLAIVLIVTMYNYPKKIKFHEKYLKNSRNVASQKNASVDLSHGWHYAVVKEDRDPEDITSDSSLTWKSFDPANASDYADKIIGHYWLRKEFTLTKEFNYPSLVLGLVSKYHRAYLNGHFVGGSDYFEHVAQYNIDPKILHLNNSNVILIKAITPKTYKPGLIYLGSTGIQLGEFGEIQGRIQRDTILFYVVRTVYLVVTFLTSLFCFVFLTFNWSRKHLLYFSLYLILGTLSLLYYNFFVSTALNYQLHRLIKVFSIGTATFVLSSTFWFLAKKHKLEMLSNIAGLVFSVAIFVGLLAEDISTATFSNRYQLFFGITYIATLIWHIPALILFFRNLVPKNGVKKPSTVTIYYQIMVLASGVLTGLMCLSASDLLWARDYTFINYVVENIGASHSFVFSLFILVGGCFEHIKFLRRVEFESHKDRFNLELVRALSSGKNLLNTVSVLQERMCQFIGCERSTIYLLENKLKNRFLEAGFIYGDRSATSMVRKEISPNKGLIGKVVATQKALLVKNVDHEPESDKSTSFDHHYKTKSCIVAPFLLEGELIGVVTVADKTKGRSFNQQDLSIIEEISKDLALICKAAKLKDSLHVQLDGIISALAKMIEKRDPYTEFHSQGVMYLTEQIARSVDYPVSHELKVAALLHDIGKIFIPPRVLYKPVPLNKREREAIEKHASWSAEILKNITGFEQISLWASLHHEAVNGEGYPYGLTGDLIPFEAQIISVADFIDALATNRAYRPKFSYKKVQSMLEEKGKAGRFDPKLVKAGVQVIQSAEFRRLYSEKGTSFRPDSVTVDQAAVDYYIEPFDEFIGNIQEFCEYLRTTNKRYPSKKLNLTLSSIRRLGEELTDLANQMGKIAKAKSVERIKRKAS